MNHLKFLAVAAAAIAALSGAPTNRLPFLPPAGAFQRWGGGRRSGRGLSDKNHDARRYGIPKAFRQYARRYGSDAATMAAMHLQIPAPMLDHWRDRRARIAKAIIGSR